MRLGAVAQLGERQLCKLDVVGSIPIGSTRNFPLPLFDNCICASRQECVVRRASVNHGAALDPGLLEEVEQQGKEMTKLQRAHDGCLGDRRRRRTWVAAKSVGEPLTRL